MGSLAKAAARIDGRFLSVTGTAYRSVLSEKRRNGARMVWEDAQSGAHWQVSPVARYEAMFLGHLLNAPNGTIVIIRTGNDSKARSTSSMGAEIGAHRFRPSVDNCVTAIAEYDARDYRHGEVIRRANP